MTVAITLIRKVHAFLGAGRGREGKKSVTSI